MKKCHFASALFALLHGRPLLSTVKLANEKLSVPITCKIRVFTEVDKTVRYAQMLERAGCQVGLHHISY